MSKYKPQMKTPAHQLQIGIKSYARVKSPHTLESQTPCLNPNPSNKISNALQNAVNRFNRQMDIT